jgi:predicted acylesterase/phospholipase RssA
MIIKRGLSQATFSAFPGLLYAIAARVWTIAVGFAAIVGLAGCLHTDRLSGVPVNQAKHASVLGIPNARFFVDEPAPLIGEALRAYRREIVYYRGRGIALPPSNFLAVSGGGDDGAFGAGLLVGWSERGDRPQFKLVTGVSTGALIAPFAFLGPEYDRGLTEVYTTIDQKDILEKRFVLAALTEDGLADTAPLFRLIERHLDEVMIERIAVEYDRGRLLLIATTNLDAARPVIWNIGAIARSGKPGSHELIRRILLASASIPGAFPPVMFDVDVDGKSHQELHVDGGAVAQAFLYPPSISVRDMTAVMRDRTRTAFIIRNGKLAAPAEETKRQTLTIAGRAIATLIASNGVGDMYRMYATARRDGVGYNLAYIGDDFTEPYPGLFDRAYMNKLFNYGRAKGRAGYQWLHTPPGLGVGRK